MNVVEASPPLVRLLAHSHRVWRLLDADAGRVARTVHPTLTAVAAALSWHWLDAGVGVALRGHVACVRRFAAAWPKAACAVFVMLVATSNEANAAVVRALPSRVTGVALRGYATDAVLAALPLHFSASLRELDVGCCANVTSLPHLHYRALLTLRCWHTGVGDAALATLPSCLRELDVRFCRRVTAAASFAHLPALTRLHCTCTGVGDAALATLPLHCLHCASLRELDVGWCANITAAASFAHLQQLAQLTCVHTGVGDVAIATLPPSLRELNVSNCDNVTAAASFAHLQNLAKLRCHNTGVGDAAIATLRCSASLRELNVSNCDNVTAAVSFAHLHCSALAVLDCRHTGVGNAAVATLPPSLRELDVSWCAGVDDAAVATLSLHCSASLCVLDIHGCTNVTAAVSFAHLHKLTKLTCWETGVGDAAVATLPPSLHELDVSWCAGVTAAASFAHLPALRSLHLRERPS